ncbi:MAG: hypothetical protein PHR45_05720 [Muribaculaceae bacterium]|nr:hypothetical protein [Muribaculaceae bacterium]
MIYVPLHPMVVHFPIALALVAFAFDASSYFYKKIWIKPASIILTIIASIGAILAVASGFLSTEAVAGYASTLKDTHVMLAIISSILLAITSGVGIMTINGFTDKSKISYIFSFLLFLSALSILITGFKGSTIVYSVWAF